MSHEIEGNKFHQAFASRSEPAWHGLGTVFDHDVTTAEMLDLALLSGWNVRTESLSEHLTDHNFGNGDHFLVVRDNPFDRKAKKKVRRDVLGVVGSRYTTVQNEDVFAFGDALLDGGGRWETAGSIKGGTVVFGSLAETDSIVIDPSGANDQINTYLLVVTSHDGTLPVIAARTPVRVVCQNTLNVALRGAKQTFRIRHTQSQEGRVAEARQALGIAHAYDKVFEAEARKMMERTITNDEFWKIVESVMPKPDADASKTAITRWQNQAEKIEAIYNSSVDDAPKTIENIHGTAWGALNTLTEFADWYRIRTSDDEHALACVSGFDANANRKRQGIWDSVSKFVKA